MFGFLKKKKDAPAPDPEAVKLAERLNVQTQIAELQSQKSELRRQSEQMNSDIACKGVDREQLMAEIRMASPTRKTALAIRVKNIDREVAGLTNSLALIEQQIGNIDAKILQLRATIVIETGDTEPVVSSSALQEKLQNATAKKTAGDINAGIAESMFTGLTGDSAMIESDVADILAEADGTSLATSPDTTVGQSPDDGHSPRPLPASQY